MSKFPLPEGVEYSPPGTDRIRVLSTFFDHDYRSNQSVLLTAYVDQLHQYLISE